MRKMPHRLSVCSISFLIVCLILPAIPFSQTPINGNPPITDPEKAGKTVESYCAAWMNAKYDEMYLLASKEGMGKTGKEKFVTSCEKYAAEGAKLTGFSIENAMADESNVIVKTKLKFAKESRPRMVNGVHLFTVTKDNTEDWKIKYIAPPMNPPKVEGMEGAGHPGE
jgi:hypothetical protein